MDETTFRILDTLARSLGRLLSINELTRKMQQLHGTAYYANTYRKLQDMSKHGIITLIKAGKSSLVSLNFENYLTIDILTEMEIERKLRLLEKRPDALSTLSDIDRQFRNLRFIKSVSMINPEKNLKLNRVELLIIFDHVDIGEAPKISAAIQAIRRIRNIKIDCLTLASGEFLNILKSEEKNPLQEMLTDEMTIFHPEDLWHEIRDAYEQGIRIKTTEKETNPAKIPEQDLTYNLSRFGYREIGAEPKRGDNICIEYVVTAILMKNDARRITAIPLILAKNKTNYNLLTFLSQKYELSGRLLGLLKVLNKTRHINEIQEAIGSLEAMNVKEIKADEKGIREKMRLYNA